MDKMDRAEKLWGSICGIVAIVAAIAELLLSGIDAASVAGAIKDIAGTAVVFFVLITFINNLPKKPKNLKEILEKAVEGWGEENAPLIFKTEGYVAAQNSAYTQGFSLLQEPKRYVALANGGLDKNSPEWKKYAQYGNGKLTGKFLDFPSYAAMLAGDFDMVLVMEQSHFQKNPAINEIIDDMVSAINLRNSAVIRAVRVGNAGRIRLLCKKIVTVEDVEAFVATLDFALSLVKVVI